MTKRIGSTGRIWGTECLGGALDGEQSLVKKDRDEKRGGEFRR